MKSILIKYDNLTSDEVSIINSIIKYQNFNPGLLDEFCVHIYAMNIWNSLDVLYRKMYEDTYMRVAKCESTFWNTKSSDGDIVWVSDICVTVSELFTIYHTSVIQSTLPKKKPETLNDYCDTVSDFLNNSLSDTERRVYFDASIQKLRVMPYENIYGFSDAFLGTINSISSETIKLTDYDITKRDFAISPQRKLTIFQCHGTNHYSSLSHKEAAFSILNRMQSDSCKNNFIVGITQNINNLYVATIHD